MRNDHQITCGGFIFQKCHGTADCMCVAPSNTSWVQAHRAPRRGFKLLILLCLCKTWRSDSFSAFCDDCVNATLKIKKGKAGQGDLVGQCGEKVRQKVQRGHGNEKRGEIRYCRSQKEEGSEAEQSREGATVIRGWEEKRGRLLWGVIKALNPLQHWPLELERDQGSTREASVRTRMRREAPQHL